MKGRDLVRYKKSPGRNTSDLKELTPKSVSKMRRWSEVSGGRVWDNKLARCVQRRYSLSHPGLQDKENAHE
jgi:hypothetical protein